VGSRLIGETERPVAVSEYLVERMVTAGATKICFVISPGKSDILEYYGGRVYSTDVCYTVQPEALGLCDAIFRAMPFVGENEPVLVGLPDTVWFPKDGFTFLDEDVLSFLLFPVSRPEFFDAVVTDDSGSVREIQVKCMAARSHWVWGAFKVPPRALKELYQLWVDRDRKDEYIGTLVNAYLKQGGKARGVHAGESYVDVGTLHGYREAIKTLGATYEHV